jgi:hypothetical protein
MPAQQGPRGDDQAQLAEAAPWQQPGQRGQDRPVSRRQPRCPSFALEHGELVAQEEDLGVLGAIQPGEQSKPAEDAEHRHVGESQ